jgi:hypothetical protein
MDTLVCEATTLAEDDLVDLWLELARDVIEHAKTTGEWLASGLRPADKGALATELDRLGYERDGPCG